MEDVEDYDADRAEQMLPYLKWSLICLNAGRALIICLALCKTLSISKIIIYYETLIAMLEAFLPMDVDMGRANLVQAYR